MLLTIEGLSVIFIKNDFVKCACIILEIIFPLYDKGFHFKTKGKTLTVKGHQLKRQSFNCKRISSRFNF